MIHCKMEESNIILEFVDNLEATKFALGYAEIYGKATPEETNELLEEGIEIETIPWVNKSEN